MIESRKDVLDQYEVEEGVIRSPGKFEGEAVYVPYLWEIYLNGGATEDDGETITIEIDADDRLKFPELEQVVRAYLEQDSTGFVYCHIEEITDAMDQVRERQLS
jgi:hypothetical protein